MAVSRVTLPRVLAILLALGLFGVPGLVHPTRAYACSCKGVSTTQALRNADAVFHGRVTDKSARGRSSAQRADLRFSVDAVYKGTVFRDQVVSSAQSSASCGLDPEIGTSWVIFAMEDIEGTGDNTVMRLATTSCSGDLPTANAPAVLGRPTAPLQGASDRAERSTRADRRLSRGLLIAGIGLVGLVLVSGAGLGVMWKHRRS